MKKILTIITLAAAMVLPASAQFHGSAPYTYDLLQGVPMILVTTGVTNLPVPAFIGKDGFAITPYCVATNASTATVALLAYPASDGKKTTDTPTALGNITLNGTTAVRSSVRVAGTTFYGTGMLYIQVTNTHTASIIVSNIIVSSW
jgi:hypothetical protein